ncbi:MAG: ATP-binding cassette domain-containing protein, partial [Ilumatobacter sp.]|nr:ATP-binding cassette domain-containing protein [Ilumatobacter sp.]
MSDATTASDTPVIEVRQLIGGYTSDVNILNGCDLTVAPGEFVGIIGPNGAGKSTLLKAILGMLKIRSGSVHLRGEQITGTKAHALVG